MGAGLQRANTGSSLLSLTSPPVALLPAAHQNLQYGEFRSGYDKDTSDTRLVWYGLRYIVENYLLRQWTVEDVERADLFFRYVMTLCSVAGRCEFQKRQAGTVYLAKQAATGGTMPRMLGWTVGWVQVAHGAWLHRVPIPQGVDAEVYRREQW